MQVKTLTGLLSLRSNCSPQHMFGVSDMCLFHEVQTHSGMLFIVRGRLSCQRRSKCVAMNNSGALWEKGSVTSNYLGETFANLTSVNRSIQSFVIGAPCAQRARNGGRRDGKEENIKKENMSGRKNKTYNKHTHHVCYWGLHEWTVLLYIEGCS